MPLMTCEVNGSSGWKWGNSGHCYVGGLEAKKKAIKQGLAEGGGKLEKSDFDLVASEIMKFDEDRQLVFGYAMLSIKKDGNQLVDLQGDAIDPADLEEGAYEFVLSYSDAATGEMHKGGSVGRLVESVVFTEAKLEKMGIPKGTVPLGWWVGFKIDSPEVFAKVKSGEYRGFSVQGLAIREEIK